ncbi:hypothetical protein DMN91_002692, partial [Ooceraea biroi]
MEDLSIATISFLVRDWRLPIQMEYGEKPNHSLYPAVLH